MTVVGVVLAAFAAGTATSATDPVASLEKTLLTRYPGVAGPLLGSAPYKAKELRVIYTLGAVSVWFQAKADRAPTCVAARGNTIALRSAILRQVMPDDDSVRFWASRGVSPARATSTFRAGILRACKLRGG
jgi:hypothetical protein